ADFPIRDRFHLELDTGPHFDSPAFEAATFANPLRLQFGRRVFSIERLSRLSPESDVGNFTVEFVHEPLELLQDIPTYPGQPRPQPPKGGHQLDDGLVLHLLFLLDAPPR